MFQQLKEDIKVYEETHLEMNPPYAQTMPELLELIDYYFQGRYRDNTMDESGAMRLFYNICRFRVLVATKASDLDTKHINILSENGYDMHAWLMSKELKLELKEEGWAELLNTMNFTRWKYGHLLVKRVRDSIEIPVLRNIGFDPEAKSILSSRFLYEKHYWSPQEFRAEGKKQRWDKQAMETIIDYYRDKGEQILVYERYGEVPGDVFERNEDWVEARTVTSEPMVKGKDADNVEGVILAKRMTSDRPYKEKKLEDVPGRAIGLGEVEKRLDSQVRRNDTVHLRSKALVWKALHIFQSRELGTERNLLTDLENGAILESPTPITHVNTTDNQDLAAYQQDEQDWDMNDDRDSFSRDIMQGDRPPAGTPLGSAMLAAQMAGGYFDLKREEYGLFLRELLFDWVIPAFAKRNNAAHLMKFVGDEAEVEKLDRLVMNNRVRNRMIEFARANNRFPSSDQVRVFKTTEAAKLASTNDRYVNLPKDFYKDLHYKIDIDITGESVNADVKQRFLMLLMQILNGNPGVLQDPQLRKILFAMSEQFGINLSEILTPIPVDAQAQAQEVRGQQQGGSLSMPPPESISMGEEQQNV